MRGLLYILGNKAMPKLLEIGYTTRSIKERLLELSHTGVPIAFELEFFVEVTHAFDLEQLLHEKLHRSRFAEEFSR